MFSHHTQEPQHDVEDLRLGEEVLSKFNTHQSLEESDGSEGRDKQANYFFV